MKDWYRTLAASPGLPKAAATELRDAGFVVIAGPAVPGGALRLANAYDRAVAAADPVDPLSIVLFNGSTWHGHGANRSARPRRSIQGAFIPRDATAAIDQAARIRPETLQRIGPLAKAVLGLPQAT